MTHRSFSPALLAALALSCASLPSLQAAETDAFSREPYVQLATDSSIFIVWRTPGAIAPKVQIGADPSALDKQLAPAAIAVRQTAGGETSPGSAPPLHSAPDGTHQYEAQVTGLEADTIYYYAIFDGDQRLTPADPSYRFRTHPKPGTLRPAYFWVVGDSGTGGSAQAKVRDAMLAYNKSKALNLDLYVHVGDMAYGSGTDKEFSERFFRMYEPTLRNTVCWAAMGNHEGNTSKGENGVGPFYDAFVCPSAAESGGLPSGKEAYYSFDYGKVHFIALDSHDLDRRPTGAMAQWLKADLEKTNADWLVCFFHHPPYTKGTHDSDREGQLIEMREHIMPILEGGGVDIVFTGHSHIYERSMLIDGAYVTPTTAEGVVLDDGDGDPAGDGAYKKSAGLTPHNGTVQVVTGHGGTGVGRKGTMPVMRKIIVENGSMLISVEGDTLTGTMLNLDGTVRDAFAIEKGGTVTHTPLADPWQPSGAKKPGKQTAGGKVPAGSELVIAPGAKWRYFTGKDPGGDWTSPKFDDTAWPIDMAGFGYGDKDDATELDMSGKFKTVYVRRPFTLPEGADPKKLGLAISYDDAFIAYINGDEVARVGVDFGSGPKARGFHPHEANGKFEYFPLGKHSNFLQEGTNVIAIEGHNANLDSSDFTLNPSLILVK